MKRIGSLISHQNSRPVVASHAISPKDKPRPGRVQADTAPAGRKPGLSRVGLSIPGAAATINAIPLSPLQAQGDRSRPGVITYSRLMNSETFYRNPPIVEAVIDLRVALRPDTDATVFDHVTAKQADRYPRRKKVVQSRGLLVLGENPSSSVEARDNGLVLISDDERQIAQFRPDGFSFSRLAPYQGWAPFRDEARRLWRLYRSALSAPPVVRIAVRYVNRIEIDQTQGVWSDYLKTYPEISAGHSPKVTGLLLMLDLPQPDLKSSLRFIESVDPAMSSDERVIVVLDLDLFRIEEPPSDDDAIWNLLELFRARKNVVFEASITDRVREMIR